ncbi:hypothetical protein Franean1_2530 [Parafrankia sp. EAN1pec]|nr:hypothetical protein Franean1_2530 [Frankia sp. EAN1pec]
MHPTMDAPWASAYLPADLHGGAVPQHALEYRGDLGAQRPWQLARSGNNNPKGPGSGPCHQAPTGVLPQLRTNVDEGEASTERRWVPAAALAHGRRPVEVNTDKASAYPRILYEPLPETCHVDARRENNRIGSDHSRLKGRLRPMRGPKRLRSTQTISAGHLGSEHPPRPL